MNNIKFPIRSEDILYSNEGRMHSIWRIFTMDDKGELKIYKKRIKFDGNKHQLDINEVTNVFTTRQKPSYGAYFVSGAISIFLIWYSFIYLASSIEYFLIFFTIIIILYPVSLFFTRSNWVGIEYKDNSSLKTVYFSEGLLPEGSALRSEYEMEMSGSLLKKFMSLETVEYD